MRIFAMMLILLWHIKDHFMPSNSWGGGGEVNLLLSLTQIFISFHVDLFILITGYFGIKHPKNSFLRILTICMFYALILNLLNLYISGEIKWTEILLPMSGSPWWFLKVYMLIVLVSPILEVFVKHATKRHFYGILAVAAFIDMYMGFALQIAPYYNHGYDIFNFVFLYLLGRTLHREDKIITGFQSRPWLITLVLLVCCVIRWKVQPFHSEIWYDYNSPLCILMAVCVFCLFQHIHVPEHFGKPIMFLSSSAISVYLITDYHGLRPTIANIFLSGLTVFENSLALSCLYIIAFMLFTYILCCLFDMLRITLNRVIGSSYIAIRKIVE